MLRDRILGVVGLLFGCGHGLGGVLRCCLLVLKHWGKEGTNRFITTSESTSPSTPPYPFFTTSSHTSPSRTLLTSPLHSLLPNACLPSSGSSSTIAFSIVRYKLHTLILVVRLAPREMGAGSGSAFGFVSSRAGGVMTGRIVESDSGRRRVRKSVDDCL
jgi:hypothetical protein